MKNKAILLVDDEEIILKTIGKDLRAEGYDVTTARNGDRAIATLNQHHFDLVVTDLMMEGLDGIQVLKQAKKIDPALPVIILTGYGDMTTAIEALRLGADDYLLKPCDVEELLFRVSGCLDKYELKRKIKLYEGILPICAVCKKIRDDTGKEPGEGVWMTVEAYINAKTGVRFSHGYCKECGKEFLDSIRSTKGK
jgi:DNA-binding NtrC family response regulator